MKAIALSLVLCSASLASASTLYNVNLKIGAGSVTGDIVTDGTIGSNVAFLDWNLLVNDGTSSFDLTGPLSGDNSGLFDHAGPGDLTATPTQILFNFSDTSTTNFFDFNNGTFPEYVLCFASAPSTCWPGFSSGEIVALFTGVGTGDMVQFEPVAGTEAIATTGSPVPEPTTLLLLGIGVALISFRAGTRRDRSGRGVLKAAGLHD